MRYRRLIAFFLAATLPVFAQDPSAPAPGQPADDALYYELAARGLDRLLEKAFDQNRVPPERRQAIRSIAALTALSDPASKKTTAERQELIRKAVAGIERALPSLSDPKSLMEQASILITDGCGRDLNTLEYFGENTRTEASLNTVAVAVNKLLDKAAAEANAQAERLSAQLRGPGDPGTARYEQLANLAQNAEYTNRMADYALAISLDPADPRRKDIAGRAITYLEQFDTPESGVQPVVRMRIAKLLLTAGRFDEAARLFDTIATSPDIKPDPTAGQRFEALYFAAVSELKAGHADAAQKRLDALAQWAVRNLPPQKAARDGAQAALAMLQHRIFLAQSATNPAAADKAVAVLMKLVKDRPDLAGVIYEQLANRLPESAPLNTLDPLLLSALMRRADQERITSSPDPKVLNRGLDAAAELIARKNIDADLLEDARLLSAFLLERLGRHDDAAAALLDFAQNYGARSADSPRALESAMSVVATMRKTRSDDPAVVALYERLLALAVDPPFNRTELAFEWAWRLQKLGKYEQAARYFQRVPETDSRYGQATFLRLLALKQQWDQPGASRPNQQLLRTEIDATARKILSATAAKTDPDQRLMNARTRLLLADVLRRDPGGAAQAIAALENFESATEGLPQAPQFLSQALFVRVNAYMSLGQNDRATASLVELLKKTGGAEGADIVFNLLTRLNEDLDRARAVSDAAAMQRIARSRAELSGFLVEWARTNEDPRIRQYTYRYAVFDADAKRVSAELEPAGDARAAAQQRALAAFQQLQSPANLELYKATLPESQRNLIDYDPAVSFGIALIQFDLADYRTAQATLTQLLTDGRLGHPLITAEESGTEKITDNDRFWEATLKLMKCNQALAKTDPAMQPALEDTKTRLGRLFIQYGERTGGMRWHEDFVALAKELGVKTAG